MPSLFCEIKNSSRIHKDSAFIRFLLTASMDSAVVISFPFLFSYFVFHIGFATIWLRELELKFWSLAFYSHNGLSLLHCFVFFLFIFRNSTSFLGYTSFSSVFFSTSILWSLKPKYSLIHVHVEWNIKKDTKKNLK